VLTTSDQPFLLDERLTGYREVSRQFTFSAAEGPGLFPGLPGRVFISGRPEWTSNVMYYNPSEYLRVNYAIHNEVRGSLAMPVFDPRSGSCCAVLEVVMTQEKDNFCSEMDNLSNALQVVYSVLHNIFLFRTGVSIQYSCGEMHCSKKKLLPLSIKGCCKFV
jgi:hypothetical protein